MELDITRDNDKVRIFLFFFETFSTQKQQKHSENDQDAQTVHANQNEDARSKTIGEEKVLVQGFRFSVSGHGESLA